MQLSKNFTVAELTTTSTGLYNTPGEVELDKLLYLAVYILQPIRDKFNCAVHINSGFRSKQVNTAIKGVLTSQHMKGEAADIVPDHNIKEVFEWAKANLKYGQIILETKNLPNGSSNQWIHISLPRIGGVNQQAMVAEINGGNTVYKAA